MRKIFLLCCLTFLGVTTAKAQTLSAKIDSVGYVAETVCRVSVVAGAYLLTPESVPTQRYAPINMTTTYQKEGVLVLVSGVIGAIPPNVRMIGTPFEIRSITFAETVTGGIKPSHPSTQPAGSKVSNDAATIDYRIPVKDTRGIVRKMTGDQFVIEVGSTRYLPDKMPDNLKVDGMRVRFSGKAGQLPPTARLLGTPLQVSKIMKDKGKLVKRGNAANGKKVTKKK